MLKTLYDELIKNVNAIDNSKLSKKEIKISDIGGRIFNIIGLVANAALSAVENKTLNVSDPVKKQIMIQKYQKLTKNILLLLIIINLQMIYLFKSKPLPIYGAFFPNLKYFGWK